MNVTLKDKAGLLFIGTGMLLAAAQTQAEESIAIIDVQADQIEEESNLAIINTGDLDYVPTDSAQLLKATPGANVNSNGSLTGITQYRGMYGSRVNSKIDGLNIAPAGPNWMDPPLSHIVPGQLESLTVVRGISPVSLGAESIGGTVLAKRKKLPFGMGTELTPSGDFFLGGETANSAYSSGGQIALVNDHHRLQLNANFDQTQNIRAGNGLDIVPSKVQRRSNWGVDYAYLADFGVTGVNYSRNEVRASGTPALPMDIVSVDGDVFGMNMDVDVDGFNIISDIHYMDTLHVMDNFSMRTAPTMTMMGMTTPMLRTATTSAKDLAYSLQSSMEMANGKLTFGTDGWLVEHQADVYDPVNAAFHLQNYNQIKRNRYSLFTEWEHYFSPQNSIQAGLRYSRVNMNAGTVTAAGFNGMMANAINMLANNFNHAQRQQNDNLFDTTLQFNHKANEQLSFSLAVAQKERAPSYQERYLWSPLESTAGLADRRTYIGRTDLKQETAYSIDMGMDYTDEHYYFTPHVFYQRVNNYIQGTPLTSGTAYNFRVMQGDMLNPGFCTANPTASFCTPLQFSNVTAAFYGVDAGMGMVLNDNLHLDGTMSYVRGKRLDITDNIYRVAPLNGSLSLTYEQDDQWSVSTQGEFYAQQNHVSATNAESKTAAYSIYHLSGHYRINDYFDLSMGVNNLLDKFYQAHLGAYNRVTRDANGQSSAVPTGQRMPGEGRSFFAQLKGYF